MMKGVASVSAEQADIIDRAIGWHLRLADATDADWSDFILWLEADPRHAAAFDEIAAQDRLIGGARFPETTPEPVAANDNIRTRRLWLAGGIAAAVAAALVLPMALTPRAAPYEIATKAGERRTVALGDGTRIEMSGGTTLKLDRADPRVASLGQGEAVFHVRHDAARPFTLTAGDTTIRDLGTVFNVARDGQQLSVAVSEGAVLFRPGRDAVTLGAGDALSARSDGAGIVRSRIDPAMVGGWRKGMLSFHNQRLGDVAVTLDRLYRVRLVLGSGLSDQPFTGMVRFTGFADRDVPHLAELIGATWRRDGERWILSNAGANSR
jgi:transmembrane sensor